MTHSPQKKQVRALQAATGMSYQAALTFLRTPPRERAKLKLRPAQGVTDAELQAFLTKVGDYQAR